MARRFGLQRNNSVMPSGCCSDGMTELFRWRPNLRAMCDYARGATHQAAFGHNLMMARGLSENGSDVEKYVNDFLTHVTSHEVGHTLGLRHNFRASTAQQ